MLSIATRDGTGSSPTPTSSTNQITTYTYDGDGHELTQTAVMPSGTNSQTTAYVYGVTSGTYNFVFSNDLLAKIEYPNASTGAASTSASDDQSFYYNALGQKNLFVDQNVNGHQYVYDVLGRLTMDYLAWYPGSGIYATTWGLGYKYDDAGRPYQQTSYNNSALTSVENQVQDTYNGYGQLIKEYQNVSGAVSTSTTPYVGYTYSQPSGANYSRLTAMSYPNGRILDYGYNSGIDTTISRISYMADDGGSSAGVHLAEYGYLGLGTIVKENEPENNSQLTYVHQSGDTLSSSDGGDQYTGLDRFGRVIDQYWLNTSSGTATDRLQYGYDRDGNVLYSKNLVNGAFSELYHANSSASGDNNSAYDSLNRLASFRRGTLTSTSNNGTSLDTITTANLNSTTGVPNVDSWSLDAIGNWNSSAPGGTTVSNTFNSKNEETANGSSSLTFDANGNMLTDGSGLTYHYDGWNRLVQVTDAGSTVQMSRSYDALGRADVYNSPSSGYLDWYYSTQNQCVEEQAGNSYVQYVWGLGYQNQLVLRDRNVNGTGSLGKTSSGLSERLYVQQDANYNVISLTSQTGSSGSCTTLMGQRRSSPQAGPAAATELHGYTPSRVVGRRVLGT